MRLTSVLTAMLLALVLGSAGCKGDKDQPAPGSPDKQDAEPLVKVPEPEAPAPGEVPSGSALWEKAVSEKTIEAYNAYLAAEPYGPHAKEAKGALLKLWGEKVNQLSVEDMEKAVAVIETNRGVIKLKFYPDVAPEHCRNFIKLAQSHFYDGLIFHRVIAGFMIQGGDPKGNGTGGPGYSIKAEFNDRPHVDGTLSMARSQNPDSAGSQFFICAGRQEFLDGKYTVFGQVIEGLDVVHAIEKTPTNRQAGDRPLQDQVMEKVYIEGL